MNDLRIGHHVITEHGNGTVAAITDGSATTDILRYRVVCGDQDHWFYLDELIAIDNEPPAHHRPAGADTIAPAPTRHPSATTSTADPSPDRRRINQRQRHQRCPNTLASTDVSVTDLSPPTTPTRHGRGQSAAPCNTAPQRVDPDTKFTGDARPGFTTTTTFTHQANIDLDAWPTGSPKRIDTRLEQPGPHHRRRDPVLTGQGPNRSGAVVVRRHLLDAGTHTRSMVRLQIVSLQPPRRRLTTHPSSSTNRRHRVTGTKTLRTPVAVVNACLHDGPHPDTTRPSTLNNTTAGSYRTHSTTRCRRVDTRGKRPAAR